MILKTAAGLRELASAEKRQPGLQITRPIIGFLSYICIYAAAQLLKEVAFYHKMPFRKNPLVGSVPTSLLNGLKVSQPLCVSSVCYIADSPENKALLSEHGLRALCILRV